MAATKKTNLSQYTKAKQLTLPFLQYWPVVGVGIVTALIILWGLADSSLADWDEGIYAQISKEMVQSGNWLTMHFGNEPWFEKPPLLMWTTAAFFKLFGINEFTARAASAFSGIVLIIVTYLISANVYNKWVGFFAVIVLLTSYRFMASARVGMTDIMLTLFIYLAFYGYLRLEQTNNRKWWYMILIAAAFGFMTKSAAIIVLPIVIVLLLLLNKSLLASLRTKHFWLGLIVVGLIVAPWHIIMYLQHNFTFVDSYLGRHIVERSVSALETHVGDGYFYVWTLQYQFFPWFYLIPFALALSLQENVKKRSSSQLLLLTIVVVFGFYTVVKTKLDWYIVPLLPALAILTAATIFQAFKSYKSIAFSGLIMSALVAALTTPLYLVLTFGGTALLAVFVTWAVSKQINADKLSNFFVDNLKVGAVYKENKENVYTSLVAGSVTVIVCLFFIVAGIRMISPLYYPQVSSVSKLAELASSNTNTQEPLIIASGLWPQTALFYSGRPVYVPYDWDGLEIFNSTQTSDIILAKDDIEFLLAEHNVEIVAEADPLIYATISPKDGPVPVVNQKIYYQAPNAGEVFFVWGINGWNVLPKSDRPASTTLDENKVMQTPMQQQDDLFVVEIQTPKGLTVDYNFHITKKDDGSTIKSVWDTNKAYQTVVSTPNDITIEASSVVSEQIVAAESKRTFRWTTPLQQLWSSN